MARQNSDNSDQPREKKFNFFKWMIIALCGVLVFFFISGIFNQNGTGLGSNLQNAKEKTLSLVDANKAIGECREKLFNLDGKIEQYFLQSSTSRATLQSKFKIAMVKDKNLTDLTINSNLTRFQELSNPKLTTQVEEKKVQDIPSNGNVEIDKINKDNANFAKTSNKTAEQVLNINNTPLPSNLINDLAKNLVTSQPLDQKLWDDLYIEAGIQEVKLQKIGEELISLKVDFSKFYQNGKYYLPFNITGRDGDINVYNKLRCIPTLTVGDMAEVKDYLGTTYRLPVTSATKVEKDTGIRNDTMFGN